MKVDITSANAAVPQGKRLAGPHRMPHVCTSLVETTLARSNPPADWRWRAAWPRPLVAVSLGLATLWRALVAGTRRAPKLLVVSETAALGDRRMVSVLQFEGQRFLIGCGPSTVTLLARLPDVRAGEANPADSRPTPGPLVDGGGV